MIPQHLFHKQDTPVGRNIRQSNEPTMASLLHKNEFPKIFIQRHEHPSFMGRPFQ